MNAVEFAGEEEGVTDAFLPGGVGRGRVVGEPGFGGIWAKFCAPQADFSPFRSQGAALGARKRPSLGRATLHEADETIGFAFDEARAVSWDEYSAGLQRAAR
jgi:hypothetical protein